MLFYALNRYWLNRYLGLNQVYISCHGLCYVPGHYYNTCTVQVVVLYTTLFYIKALRNRLYKEVSTQK